MLSLGLTLAEGVWDLPEEAVESFEWAHTLLFVAALVLVGFAASLIEACARISARYHATEGISLTSLIRRNDKYLRKGGDATKSCDDVIVVSRTTVSWSEAAHYAALRQDFFNRIDLPMAFDFSLYLDGALREFIVELMEVGVASWAAVLLVVALNEARIVVFDIESLAARVGLDVGESDVFLAAGWLLVAWSASLRGRLEQAWTQLLKNISCATPTCLGGKLRKARTARLLAGGERKREEKLEATIEKRERRRSEVPTANELEYEEEVETLEKDDEDDPLGVHEQEEEAELRTIRRSASVTRDVVAKLLHEGAAPPAADAVGTPAFRDVFPRDSPRFFSALVGALMLLNCFYGALLVMRYGKLAYAFEAGGTCAAGVVGGSSAARAAYVLATVAPIPLVLSAIRKLVATGSFIASLAHESEELVDEVLEESLKREHDVHAVRVAFRLAFETAGGASVDDLRKVFDTFDVDKGRRDLQGGGGEARALDPRPPPAARALRPHLARAQQRRGRRRRLRRVHDLRRPGLPPALAQVRRLRPEARPRRRDAREVAAEAPRLPLRRAAEHGRPLPGRGRRRGRVVRRAGFLSRAPVPNSPPSRRTVS